MKTEKILEEINSSIASAKLSELGKNLDLLLKVTSDEDASAKLSEILLEFYTPFKSGYLAKVLETIIRKKITLALVNHPQNFLFQTAVSTGSSDLYECYVEEAVIPFLNNVVIDEHELHYAELLCTAQELNDKLFEEHKKCIKGRHYNGTFTPENNEGPVQINRVDYQIMEDVVNRYNTIVGRRDIIKDLTARAGLDLESD